ncbi:MAG TPA: hypothetical protein VFP22_10850 [Candidatus Limnocylindrales bacterium]|nr:hypothetical protein [Candidatus Limnocylindrales bacterium]
MTDRFEPRGTDTPVRPLGSADDESAPRDEGEEGRLGELPAHERDDDRTTGGGLMASGGTAIDRGTGELGGQAQAADATDFGAGDSRDSRSLGDAADEALGHEDHAG